MPSYTPILGLYKPGGGATGLVQPDEPVDVDKLNENFDALDAAVGLPTWTTSTRPAHPFVNQSGYNSLTDTLEKWNGNGWVNALPSYLQASKISGTYYSQTQLNAGALDNRYYTQAQLIGGVLDSRYPLKSASASVSYNNLPFRFAFGVETAAASSFSFDSGTGRWLGGQVVTFPSGRFTSPPTAIVVSASSQFSAGVIAEVDPVPGPTASTFTCRISRTNQSDTGFFWMAAD